jgi:uncharacterized coiled-coil protein SlyX
VLGIYDTLRSRIEWFAAQVYEGRIKELESQIKKQLGELEKINDLLDNEPL